MGVVPARLLGRFAGGVVDRRRVDQTHQRGRSGRGIARLSGTGGTVMRHVNYWLASLSFLLGLVLTLTFRIRRVKREVPVHGSANFTSKSGAGAKVAPQPEAQSSEPKTEIISTPKPDDPKTEVIRRSSGDEPKTEVISRSTVAGAAAGEEPYGAGSFRLVGGARVPSGWMIKGNEESRLYHS